MDVRDAVEADADRLAELTGQPSDVMRNLVHDRTVRVATEPPDEDGEDLDLEGEASRVVGFVSYDAQNGAVHITQFEGTLEACERLLDEPLRFARGEGMPVELLVAENEDEKRDIAEAASFHHEGRGPTFDGMPTVRYRHEPTRVEQ
ncbi:hypothetical protein [Haloglomus salinum]|jgi:hypothetical protein|uniref:hypothetical protein n=1 Tax=Haloglomus salinum TaxID=2962673 RepID=UPI0020C94BC7|nr:hypothetical protein [Haloglomus salinum]